MMIRGLALVVAIAAIVIGAAVVAPSASEAVVITSVTVTVGGQTWCDTGGSCSADHKIWNLGGGVNLNPGQSLILTQNAGTPSGSTFNFDTSEGFLVGTTPSPCNTAAGHTCTTTITINGTVIAGGNDILANNNLDPGGNDHNEAANYAAYGSTAAFSVFTGYADNIHTNPCADTTGTVAGNCQPDPFAASANDTFIGNGAPTPAGFPTQTNPNHCPTTGATCFDAGVIRIIASQVSVPEPSSLLLLGVGIMSLAAWGRSRKA